jgi:sortase A
MPVPDHPGATPTEALLTMTTCHPKFTAEHRMIVYAKLAETLPRTGTEMPAGVRSLYGGG